MRVQGGTQDSKAPFRHFLTRRLHPRAASRTLNFSTCRIDVYDPIHRYRGRAHWGKNYLRTFTHPKCPIKPLYPAFDAAVEQINRADPKKIYEPTLWTQACMLVSVYYLSIYA